MLVVQQTNPRGFALAHLRRKLIRPGARGKCPKTIVIIGTSDVSCSSRLLRIPFESNGDLCYINSFRINPCHQVSVGSTDPWHHSIILNQESFTWSYTKV